MKKVFEWIGGFALIVFSFYFTDKVSLLVASKGDLMQEIKSVSKDYYISPVDAEINTSDNTIIPGIYGKEVNLEDSYASMKEFGVFNKNYLVYKPIKPEKTLNENRDKYIVGGNPRNRNISLIIDDNSSITTYLASQDIEFDEIIKDSSKTSKGEIINGAKDYKDFQGIVSEKRLCIYDYSNQEECLKRKYYIIKPVVTLNSSNIVTVKNQIKPGQLILISNNATIEHLKVLLSEIKYRDINVVYVSKLISENNISN